MTDQFILSTPIIAGITSDAKETSEIFEEIVDKARNFDRDNFDIVAIIQSYHK